MDWNKQTEAMFKNWTDAQKKMWENWQEMAKQGPSLDQATQVWQKTIENWEETVKNTMEAQSAWTKNWSESLNTDGLPEEVVNWAKQAQDMNKQFGDAQNQMWQGWFDLMKQTDFSKINSNWDGEGQQAFQQWQEMAKQVMEAQMQWVNMWMPKSGEASDKK